MLGTAHQLAGDYPEALAQYQRSLELGGDSKAHTNIGTIHYAQGRYGEAAAAFARAAELEPGSALAQRNLGDAYAKLGQADKARAAYERAVELSEEQLAVNPKDATRVAWLAVYEAKLGRHTPAARDCARAVALGSSDGEVLFACAVVHALAGHRSDALTSLERALDRGYSASLAREDEDLAMIRDTPQFRALLSKHDQPPR
jgi:serine/threonine-protein kinase